MTIQHLQFRFKEELNKVYHSDEIQAIFKYYLEIKLNIIDSLLYTNDELQFDLPELEQDLKELKAGKPIQHIVGKAFFYDYFFYVNENTLIPRPETEELIYLISEKYDQNASLRIIDLGTGSGCIPITLNKLFPHAEIYGLDISDEALNIARLNNENLGTNVKFIHQDFLEKFDLNLQFDIIISNPPYIRELEKAEMHHNVLDHEPHLALFVTDEDPLIFYRKVAEFGITHLKENGHIFCEINQYLGPETVALFSQIYGQVHLYQDISGNDRMLEAYH